MRAASYYSRNFKLRNPEKVRAHKIVYEAIRRGRLTRQPCEECCTTVRVQAHHEDYEKPLAVKWLCQPCHMRHHGPANKTVRGKFVNWEGRPRPKDLPNPDKRRRS